jgi:hypothetical protein
MSDRASMHAEGYDFTGGVTPEMVLAPVRRLLSEDTHRAPQCDADTADSSDAR